MDIATMENGPKTPPVILTSTIDENENYILGVVELKGVDLPCYGVINKRFGVCEMSTSMLANARKLHKMLNDWEIDPPKEDESSLPDMGGF